MPNTLSQPIPYTLIASYCLANTYVAHVKPYINKTPVRRELALSIQVNPLPEENHWQVVMTGQVKGINQEETLCFESTCSFEYICYALKEEGQNDIEVKKAIGHSVGSLAFAQIRANLSWLSDNSGYGATTLPPVMSDTFVSMIGD